MAWGAWWAPKTDKTTGPSLTEIADGLAARLRSHWEREAEARMLNDPYPLPVAWAAADAPLTGDLDVLKTVATGGAGWPEPTKKTRKNWAKGLEDLAGGGDKRLIDVLAAVPTGRLVVLGEPGAGKTMLMVRLVLDLLARRVSGGPVPFLASVASWNPSEQDLQGWLNGQLLIYHPALASLTAEDKTEQTRAAALLASGLILPVLDGLDEIPEKIRGPAISRINDALRPGQQVVVTCRAREYQAAVRTQDGVAMTFRGAAAVQLRPLDADAVGSYLCADAGGPDARTRWDPVLQVLGTEAPAG